MKFWLLRVSGVLVVLFDRILIIVVLASTYSKISDQYKIELFKLEDFNSIPEVPGMYSWHVACSIHSLNHVSFHKLHKDKNYDIKLEGFLGEQFDGKVSGKEVNFDDLIFDSNLLRLASAVFAPAIYVGIAKKNLNQRLSTHKKQLIKILANKDEACKSSVNLSGLSPEEQESRYFAVRFGDAICRLDLDISENDIFVKTVQLPHSFNPKNIVDTENFLNRTYNPLLGRR